jgi:signal transduction histidine kinase/ligand-binding sensor domain-containing protein/DNA-binding response OmpR family regulator
MENIGNSMRSIRKLLLAILLMYTNMSFGQISRFSHIGVSEGLSHGWAKCIEKDQHGFIWVGTVNGLNRYDGREFKIFKNAFGSEYTISDNFIQALEADSRGNLWVGTYSGGIDRYDPKSERFYSYRNAPKKLFTISDDRIHSIKEDSQGVLWVGTAKGLDRYDYEKDHFSPFYILVNNEPEFIKGIVACIYEDHSGKLWVGTDTGLYTVSPDRTKINKYLYKEKAPGGLSHPYVTAIYEDPAHTIWIGTWGGGLCKYNDSSDNFSSLSLSDNKTAPVLSHNSVLCINGNKEGEIFIGTEGGGLNVLDVLKNQIKSYSPKIGNRNGINSNSIHAIYSDTISGITWLGTYGGGLNLFSKWNKPFEQYKQDRGELNNNSILSITESDKGVVYIGTDGGGINVIDPKSNEVIYLMHDATNPYSLISNAVLDMEFDAQQNLWVGSFDGGLDFLPKGSRKFQHFYADPNNPKSLSDADVSSICVAKDGTVWVGTMTGGLNKLIPSTGQFVHFKHESGNPKTLSDDFISHIFESKDGLIYVQTGKTLDVFNPALGYFDRLDRKYNIYLGTPISSYEDSNGNIWVGTREGLHYLQQKTLSHKEFTQANGLPNNSIAGILEDGQKNIWVSTMGGLVKMGNAVINPDSIRMYTYTKEDGLQGNDFKDMACHKGHSNTLYFGGQNGVSFFDPEKIVLNPINPEVILTGFRLFNEKLEFGKSPLLTSPLNQTETIHLDYTHNVFSFEFSALNYWQSQKNQYAYIMEGFEKNWNYVGKQNSATYTNLDPGTYFFKVKAANNDGIWNEKGRVIQVIISPPWWQTTWFRLTMILLFGAIVIGSFQIWIYQIKQRQKILEREVASRTKEISQINLLLKTRNDEIEIKNDTLINNNQQLLHQNEELERQANKIQSLLKEIQELNELKLRFFTNISHELRTPLTLIIGPLEKLISSHDKKNKPQKELTVMQRNAFKLLKLINQLLDFRKIESGNIQLQAHKNDIISCIQEVVDTFKFLAERKQIQFQFQSTFSHFDLWFDAEKMEKIITNLLSNAFKYTNSGHITISAALTSDEKAVEIAIEDSGSGIAQDQIPHIFNLYFQANNASNLQQAGSGIGLALIKQYIDLHHGAIEVTSTVGLGTCFKAIFPIGSAHLSSSEIFTDEYIPATIGLTASNSYQISSTENREVLDDKISDLPLGEKPMLLIVEDNADIRDYIKTSLENDFQVAEASNGLMGLEKALEIIPDLIVSDVMMPEMNGMVMCQKLKEDEQTNHIPVILLTAYTGEEKQWEGFKSGADDYVTKPFNINLLQQKLKNISHTRAHLIEKFHQSSSLDINLLSPNEADQNFLKKAIGIINDNLTDSTLSVDNFSEHFNMSSRNLLRKLKAITGLSINEFIKSIRLKKSVEYLKSGQMNISEISYAVGFTDPKYFSKCFKNQFGKSPTEY